MADSTPNPATTQDAAAAADTAATASFDHPYDAIPLPGHGFETLDSGQHESASVAAVDVIRRAAIMLMSASAGKLGLAPGDEPDIDLDDARALIDALAGMLGGAQDHLAEHRQPLREGLRTLQKAFREASQYPDEPGDGPGESTLH